MEGSIPDEKHGSYTTVAHILVHEFICRFGVPEHLHTDQGRNFEAELIKGICTLLDIKKTRTTPYHPQSDGMIERFNRTLLSMLSTAVDQDQRSWDLQLPLLMLAYRTSMQETTRATPFFLMFGRHAKLPIDIEFNLPTSNYSSLSQYQKRLGEQLQQAYKTVRQHTLVEQTRHKVLYDRQAHGTSYHVGDEVWLHCPAVPRGRSRKLHRPWQGPFTIVKVIGSTVYRIQSSKPPRKRMVVHYNRLKPYFPPFNKEVFGPCPISPATTSKDNTEDPAPNDEQSETSESEQESRDPAAAQPDVISSEPSSPETTPPLRRSSRRRQPPDRYGSTISYPDCYSSDSDS